MAKQTAKKSGQVPEQIGVYLRGNDIPGNSDSAFQRQKQLYEARIGSVPSWELVDFYADPVPKDGKPASRAGLRRLLTDCQRGKVTQIITKSIGSLSASADELAILIQTLNSLPLPVGVYFENERFDSQGKTDIFARLF